MAKVAAVLTINRASDMTKKNKNNIADWLRKQAKALIKDGHLYSKRIRIRYLYKD
jgi:hypothetical protein